MARLSSAVWRIATALALVLSLRVSAVTSDVALGELSFATMTFSVDSGLPSNVAQALVQARDGYLWVGTEAGLARFDGVRFRIYRTSEFPELGDNLIRALFEDRDGVLWIGTQRGVVRRRAGVFERVPGLHAPVASIVQDASGGIWLGTQGAGLWEYRGGKITQRADGQLMKPTDSPMRLFVDSTNRLWAAVDRGLLLCLEHGVMRVPEPAVAGFKQVNRFLESPRGTLWFATQQALYRYRGGEVRQFGKSAGIGDEQITDLLSDRAGRLWVAGHALWVAENPEVDDFTRVPITQVEYPRYMLQDREGTYWIGSSGDGLARMRPSSFRLLRFADELPLRRARSVTVDRGGNVWAAMGNENRALVRIAPDGRMTTVPLGRGADADVWSVCASDDDGIWIGTRGSLANWRDGSVRRFSSYQNVRAIFAARDHSVWLGMVDRGLVRYRNGEFSTVNVPPEYVRATPSAMADSPDGTMFVGYASNGILKLTDAEVSVINKSNGLPSNEVRAILTDRRGRLWVGFRRQGLALLAGDRWLNPDQLVEPFGERVSAIGEDEGGNLWIGSIRGIAWGRADDFAAVAAGASAVGRFRVAGAVEGIGGGVIGIGTQPTMGKSLDGTFWFASRDGIVAVRPGTIALNRVPPPVVIENVAVDGHVTPAEPEVRLPAGVRSIEVEYTALTFVQPARVLFRYQMIGHDKNWVQAGTRRTAFYTGLRPGRYSFRVAACNEDGVWNETGAAITIVQQPWFYQTVWFYALVVLGVWSSGLGLYYWRTAALRRVLARQTEQIRAQLDKETQLRAELERTARLESLGVLAGGIAHDFNNLLTVIIANLGLAASDDRVRAVAGEQITAAERGARRAAELTQQLLTFAKGGDPVRRAVDLPDVVRESAEFARHGTQVRCELEVAPDLPPASVDRAQISRVIHNLVLNATQAMPRGGVIRIAISAVAVGTGDLPGLLPGRYIKVSLSDNGTGIPPEHLSRIFEPYFSTKPKSHGLGLATVHSIVKRHQGHITVESELDRGTTFHLWLPVAKVAVASAATPAIPSPQSTPSQLRVLFMDDEEIIRQVAAGILRHLGHDGVVVADGSDAVREYEAAHRAGRSFDVVVLDLTVPGGMGGRAAIEALQRIDPGVRAIVSSGYSSDPVLANFRQFGFRAVVPKPYQLDELARAIQQVAAERNGRSGG